MRLYRYSWLHPLRSISVVRIRAFTKRSSAKPRGAAPHCSLSRWWLTRSPHFKTKLSTTDVEVRCTPDNSTSHSACSPLSRSIFLEARPDPRRRDLGSILPSIALRPSPAIPRPRRRGHAPTDNVCRLPRAADPAPPQHPQLPAGDRAATQVAHVPPAGLARRGQYTRRQHCLRRAHAKGDGQTRAARWRR